MSVPVGQTTTTRTMYRTVNVASEPTTATVIQGGQLSPLPYSMNGSYDTVRYLVPVQQAAMQQQSVLVMPQMVQQMVPQMVPQMVSPVYLQSLPRYSVSSQEESDAMYRQYSLSESFNGKSSSVFSQSSSPIKSPEPSVEEVEEQEEEEEEVVEVEEVEIVNVIEQKPPPPLPAVIEKVVKTEVRSEVKEVPQPTKMDTRFFGELLAEVYRKNCDIHSCISEHVAKIRGRKHQLDPSNDYKMEKEEVERLIPRGATELTKQQIRYLLQTRLTADKSMRLLLSTFSSLREELINMSDDLRRIESEKEVLERDLSFKTDQALQYDRLLEGVRENNRQLQLSLKESSANQRTLESQLMSVRSTDSSREFKLKELEGRLRALEKENDMLRQKLAGQASSSTLQVKTEELSRQYNEQLNSMREEKDRELQSLRSQLTKIQTTVTTERSSTEKSLQLKISELLASLEQRQSIIKRQEEEIKKLLQEKTDSSKNVTKTIITKRYRNQYPILGLLGDDYQATSPIKEAKTIVIERTGEIIKQE
ncbi:protein POF1B isoform X2 [Myripristis murdjan]|nr:protein POF1B isoform X2 [Myripristis murdjan]